MTNPSNLVQLTTIDTDSAPWEMLHIAQTGADIPHKPLFHDDETGVTTFLIKYIAGFTNTWHTHPCAHGMFVLDGVLKTHEGEFGPGSFVWFPEGGWMQHGATADQDVTLLFITNKEFDIVYPTEGEHPYPMHKQ